MRRRAQFPCTCIFIVAVAVSLCAAAGEGDVVECGRQLDLPHALSLQGNAPKLFREITRTGETETKRPIQLDEVVRHFAACWEKAAMLQADSSERNTAPSGSLAEISFMIEEGELEGHTPERTIKLAFRAEGDAAKFAKKVARSLEQAVGEEKWADGVRDAVCRSRDRRIGVKALVPGLQWNSPTTGPS
jgi:hypothetical protein